MTLSAKGRPGDILKYKDKVFEWNEDLDTWVDISGLRLTKKDLRERREKLRAEAAAAARDEDFQPEEDATRKRPEKWKPEPRVVVPAESSRDEVRAWIHWRRDQGLSPLRDEAGETRAQRKKAAKEAFKARKEAERRAKEKKRANQAKEE